MSLLGNDNLFRTVYNEVATLVIHALLLPDDSFIVLIIKMALGTTDHDGNLAEFNLLGLVLFDELPRDIPVSLALLNVHVNLGVNLVRHVPDPGLVREVGIHLARLRVLHHGLAPRVNLTKHYLVADVVVLVVGPSRDVLPVDPYHVVLVFLHAVRDHVLDEPIEGLNLLVNDSVLIEVRIDDFPLVIKTDLVLAIVSLEGRLRKDAASR